MKPQNLYIFILIAIPRSSAAVGCAVATFDLGEINHIFFVKVEK